MIEAQYYEKLENKKVRCLICPKTCEIPDSKRGFCRARENRAGKLYSLVYGRPASAGVDPIEKKPLFHFFPGSLTYSISTVGCNFACRHCLNWQISQANPEDLPSVELPPEKVVENAVKEECRIIAFTYIEPVMFYEYMLDIIKHAKKEKIKTAMVTNGFVNPDPAKKLYSRLDAANVDLKGFTEEFYRKICAGRLAPVLDALKIIKEQDCWLELTNLIIPTLNDDLLKIKEMCEWIKTKLSSATPLHFSRFFPHYKLTDLPPTPVETLHNAYKIAKDVGLKHVYLGNIPQGEFQHTVCPRCKEILVQRSSFYEVLENNMKESRCKFCGEKIDGVFKK
ncbi:AmmeMemoRadiSam system radical SAM enzyme [Candidatus Woesearchaeota archaeon]|nr:AmmeMemoRadiSam system radical SAM enzyme [Candidatus Woesearchaeota archaeon]